LSYTRGLFCLYTRSLWHLHLVTFDTGASRQGRSLSGLPFRLSCCACCWCIQTSPTRSNSDTRCRRCSLPSRRRAILFSDTDSILGSDTHLSFGPGYWYSPKVSVWGAMTFSKLAVPFSLSGDRGRRRHKVVQSKNDERGGRWAREDEGLFKRHFHKPSSCVSRFIQKHFQTSLLFRLWL
jgi:hypothetical protein